MRLSVPASVPLPQRPQLAKARLVAASDDDAPVFTHGEVLNITNRTPDGSHVYATACGSPGGLREGWLPADWAVPLEPAEVAEVKPEAQLPLRELLQRSALVQVDEDWQDVEDAATLGLRAGEVLQLGAVIEGWAFGWPLESPSRFGWLPLAFVTRLEPTVASLARQTPLELSVNATAALVTLLRANPPPPPQRWTWEGELPVAVNESAQCVEREWQENFPEVQATQEEAVTEVVQAEDKCFAVDNAPDDSYPLVVCRTRFEPPKSAAGAMLKLEVGELVRVTSLMEAVMYFGFLDARSEHRGWFPKSHVNVVEDPLDPEADRMVAELGPPPLPKVPPALLKRRRQ